MIEFVLVFSLILWLSFIAITRIIGDLNNLRNLKGIKLRLMQLFGILDVVHNYTAGAILFMEFATWDKRTLSQRLVDLTKFRSTQKAINKYWRIPLAMFMCMYMVDPFAPGHCKL